jgi:hypothetical protein
LLDYLGLRAAFEGLGNLPCGGTASAWGGAQVAERSYLFTGRGQGWHLDRARFDGWLWERAAQAGAHVMRARATQARRVDGIWHVEVDGGASVQAEVVIDASGRSAWLARSEDALPRRDDALVATARWFEHDGGHGRIDGAPIMTCDRSVRGTLGSPRRRRRRSVLRRGAPRATSWCGPPIPNAPGR